MRRILATFLLMALSCAGCSQLPPVTPAPVPGKHGPQDVCQGAFLHTPWQLYHSITARMPGGQQAVLTGVTIVRPGEGTLRAVLMTLEGLVLFDGEYADRIVVHRALGPFARPGFARGLLADVGMLFVAPREAPEICGADARRRLVCRTALARGGWLDITADPEAGWILKRYNEQRQQERIVTGTPGLETPLARASAITLIATGSQSYRLDLKLVDAVPLGQL